MKFNRAPTGYLKYHPVINVIIDCGWWHIKYPPWVQCFGYSVIYTYRAAPHRKVRVDNLHINQYKSIGCVNELPKSDYITSFCSNHITSLHRLPTLTSLVTRSHDSALPFVYACWFGITIPICVLIWHRYSYMRTHLASLFVCTYRFGAWCDESPEHGRGCRNHLVERQLAGVFFVIGGFYRAGRTFPFVSCGCWR